MRKETIDISVDLARVVEYFDGPADEAGVRLTIDAHGTVVADRSLLQRAVSNLIANAIRFTPHGGTVSVVGTATADSYVIRVQNPGPGIPPEHRDRIFDRFYRVDPARGGSAKGVSPRLMSVLFLVIVAVAVAEAAQVVGVLLVFALMVGPAATSLRLTSRMACAIGLAVVLALAETWLGIALAYATDWPTSFWIVLLSCAAYFLSLMRWKKHNGLVDT